MPEKKLEGLAGTKAREEQMWRERRLDETKIKTRRAKIAARGIQKKVGIQESWAAQEQVRCTTTNLASNSILILILISVSF